MTRPASPIARPKLGPFEAWARDLGDAFRFALGPGGVAFAAPQLVFVAAYIVIYAAGLVTTPLGARAPIVLLAVALGLLGIVAGTAVGWRRFGRPRGPESRPGRRSPLLVAFAAVLVVVGLAALVLYFVRIGGFPILMPSAEQARLDAALAGGAPLRVTSLLTLPGAWLLLAIAVRHSRRARLGAALLVAVVAILWILTANRAPGFIAIEVAIATGLLAAGTMRLHGWGLAGLAVVALVTVMAAGGIGAVRLAPADTSPPPVLPGASTPPGVPPASIVPSPTPISPRRDYPALARRAVEDYLRVPVQNLMFTMDAVPARIGWRLGWTYLQPLVTVLPGTQTTFDADLKAALGQHYVGGGTVPGLLGESYANFGPPGWFLVPGIVAVFLAWLFSIARRLDSAAVWALYSFALIHTANAPISGLIVASPFPYIAYGLLGLAVLLEYRRRAKV